MKILDQVKMAFGAKIGSLDMDLTIDVKTDITTRPIVADLDPKRKEVIIFGTKDGRLIAVRGSGIEWIFSAKETKSDVEELFRDESRGNSINSQPIVADINKDGNLEILFGSDNGKLYALDSTGNYMWDFKTKDSIRTTPIYTDITSDNASYVIFGGNDGFLYCLDPLGALIWKFKASSGIESSPAYLVKGKERQIVFGSNDGTLYSVNSDGQLNWKHKLKAKVSAQPAIGDVFGDNDPHIAVGTTDGAMNLFSSDGELLWTYKTGGSIPNAAVLADLNNDKKLEIIFGSCDDNVYVLSAEGSKIWSFETSFWVASTPIVADIDNDGKLEVIICSYDQSVYILDGQGQYILNYVPGLSSITQQSGHYTDLLSIPPGRFVGKKIWEYRTDGKIIGSDLDKAKMSIVVTTNNGKISILKHKP